MADDLSYTVLFGGSTWRFRLGAYLRSFRAPRLFIPLIVVAMVPLAIDRVPSLFMPTEGMSIVTVSMLLMGLAGAVSVVGIGALATVLRRGPDRIVTFDVAGIHERIGDARIEHPWSSVIELRETEHTLTIHCRTPMKSFQLATSENARLFVVPLENERLDAVLSAAIPQVRRIRAGGT